MKRRWRRWRERIKGVAEAARTYGRSDRMNEYTINWAGIPFLALSALLVVGGLPIESLSQNETIITGLLVLAYSDTAQYTNSVRGAAGKAITLALLVVSLVVIAYAFWTLLT